ncbi:MAG: ExbD/TolR family protein [Myxococcaceae bacterium]
MASQQNDTDDEIVAINVTPLVDITLVLLIIFMVTANFIVKDTVEADLPRAANGGETVQALINVVVDKDGKTFFDGAEVNDQQLVEKVAEAVKKDPETRAIIGADKAQSYGRVMYVVDLIKGQGVSKLAFNVEKVGSPTPP